MTLIDIASGANQKEDGMTLVLLLFCLWSSECAQQAKEVGSLRDISVDDSVAQEIAQKLPLYDDPDTLQHLLEQTPREILETVNRLLIAEAAV